MIIGYIYSQKCNENAKLNWAITFLFLVAFFQNIKKEMLPEFKIYQLFLFGFFITLLTINIANDRNNKSSFQTV